MMHTFVRIGGLIASVVAGAALLAVGFTWAVAHFGLNLGVSGMSVFVGLVVAGLVGIAMTKDAWYYA